MGPLLRKSHKTWPLLYVKHLENIPEMMGLPRAQSLAGTMDESMNLEAHSRQSVEFIHLSVG
jgi:hypothetical protein